MTQTFVFFGGFALAVAYLFVVADPPGWVRSLLKSGAVVSLAVAAMLGNAPGFLIAALWMCALGDFCLSRPGAHAFLFGVVSFATGHVFLAGGFFLLPESDLAHVMTHAKLFVLGAMMLAGFAMAILIAPRAGRMKSAVLGYIPIILCMGLAALALPSLIYPLALPAAMSFMVSDIVLACELFVLPAAHPARRLTPYLVWPLYWGAQAGFLVAFA